jgi:CDP-diglyceride synthetase
MRQPKTLWGFFLRDFVLGIGIFTVIILITQGPGKGLGMSILFGLVMCVGRVLSEWLKRKVIAKRESKN